MAGADYRTYVVRHWRRDDGTVRVEIEHVQTGARARLASLAEALAWIDAGPPITPAWPAASPAPSGSPPDPPRSARDA
jgi:hypothetical protein